MSTESFNCNYLFAKATVTIDAETGNIIKVVHEGTNMEIDIPPDNFARFEEDTAEMRRAIVASMTDKPSKAVHHYGAFARQS